MTDDPLQALRILVVEDEYLLAHDLSTALRDAGAEVAGPFGTLGDAIAGAEADTRLDGAVLDVNLRGEMVFPLADALTARKVPFLFATGYDRWAIPDRFSEVLRLEKPLKAAKIGAALGLLLRATAAAGDPT